MNTYVYISDESTTEILNEYAAVHFSKTEIIVERFALLTDWRERTLNDILSTAKKGDRILVLDALNLARSFMQQVLSFLEASLEAGVDIQFMKYGLSFTAKPVCNFDELMQLMHKIEHDFVSQRNHEILLRRKENGTILGRPTGRKNKTLKLDKYKKDITRYVELSISKASIAKLVDCHPQTLYDWMERNKVESKKSDNVCSKKSEVI
jgi:DNA invertase Pin-like site-specific DNA recombinase